MNKTVSTSSKKFLNHPITNDSTENRIKTEPSSSQKRFSTNNILRRNVSPS